MLLVRGFQIYAPYQGGRKKLHNIDTHKNRSSIDGHKQYRQWGKHITNDNSINIEKLPAPQTNYSQFPVAGIEACKYHKISPEPTEAPIKGNRTLKCRHILWCRKECKAWKSGKTSPALSFIFIKYGIIFIHIPTACSHHTSVLRKKRLLSAPRRLNIKRPTVIIRKHPIKTPALFG